MNLVFVHDLKLREIDGKFYTTGSWLSKVLSQYLEYYDTVTVCCRAIKKQNFDTNLFLIGNSKIIIKPISHGSLVLNREEMHFLKNQIQSADALVVRLQSVLAEYAIHYAVKFNIPYLIEMVGDPWDAYWNHSIAGKFVAPIMTFLTKRELRRSKFSIYVTKKYLENRYPSKGSWIGCSDVTLRPRDPLILDKRIKNIKRRKNSDTLTIGTVAQVDVKYKGQQYVIQAISRLNKLGIKCKYCLVGSGDSSRLKKYARKLNVENQVEFVGVLAHNEVFDWLDTIDLYIQPSKQEGLPRSVAEAINQACPAVGSDVGGIGELIDKKYLFSKGDVTGIVNIIKSLRQKDLLEMAQQNFKNAQNYETALLNTKRQKFYKQFYLYCQKK